MCCISKPQIRLTCSPYNTQTLLRDEYNCSINVSLQKCLDCLKALLESSAGNTQMSWECYLNPVQESKENWVEKYPFHPFPVGRTMTCSMYLVQSARHYLVQEGSRGSLRSYKLLRTSGLRISDKLGLETLPANARTPSPCHAPLWAQCLQGGEGWVCVEGTSPCEPH